LNSLQARFLSILLQAQLGLGALQWLHVSQLTQDVLFLVFLPAMIVFASNEIHHLPAINWMLALVFGAAVSATDPISVVGLFEDLGAPRRLTLLIEGESLLNDGTAIVFFTLVLALVMGKTMSPESGRCVQTVCTTQR